jgi:hypothetical protein
LCSRRASEASSAAWTFISATSAPTVKRGVDIYFRGGHFLKIERRFGTMTTAFGTMATENKPYRCLTARQLGERYHVVIRTLDRWLQRGILPPPIIINGRRYWDEAEIMQRERAGMKPAADKTTQAAEGNAA